VAAAGLLPAWSDDWPGRVAEAVEPRPDDRYLAFLESQLRTARAADGTDSWGQSWTAAAVQVAAGGPVAAAVATIAP
jgi:hypothetical protein